MMSRKNDYKKIEESFFTLEFIRTRWGKFVVAMLYGENSTTLPHKLQSFIVSVDVDGDDVQAKLGNWWRSGYKEDWFQNMSTVECFNEQEDELKKYDRGFKAFVWWTTPTFMVEANFDIHMYYSSIKYI